MKYAHRESLSGNILSRFVGRFANFKKGHFSIIGTIPHSVKGSKENNWRHFETVRLVFQIKFISVTKLSYCLKTPAVANKTDGVEMKQCFIISPCSIFQELSPLF